jgi:hypothetical protein
MIWATAFASEAGRPALSVANLVRMFRILGTLPCSQPVSV